MRLDSQLYFVAPGTPLSIVAGTGVDTPSNVVDLFGLGVGVPITQSIIGTPTTWGSDFGLGTRKVQIECVVGTALATSNSATLNAAMQLAADDGTGNPSTYQTVIETGELTAAQLVANTIFARFDWPPVFPRTLRPRFARILFQVPAATVFTAGTIAYAIGVAARDDTANLNSPRNYVVA